MIDQNHQNNGATAVQDASARPPRPASITPSAFAPPPRAFRVAGIVLLVAGAVAGGFLLRGTLGGHAQSAPAQPVDAVRAGGVAKQLWTCGMHPQVIQDHPGDCPICHMELTPLKGDATGADGASHAHAGGPSVTIDPVIVQNMGVRVAPVTFGSVQQEVRVVGYLEEPEPLHRDINLRVSGWIEKLHADTDGMPITKDQPLFDLYSPEIQVAVTELISARRSLDAAGDEQAKQTAGTLFESTARKLELWGLQRPQVEQLAKLDQAPETVTFLAPIGGHLTEKKAYEGAGVMSGQLVMRIADRHQMWIEAQVYERQLPLVRVGSKARATIVSEPGKVFEGEVVFIHPHIDPATRTALVRIEIPNQDYHLRQGMYATVDLLAEPTPPALVVPRESVVDTGTRQVVFVSLGGGRFEPRNVKLGLGGRDGQVQVLAGLEPNEFAVTSGQFLLDSESRLKEAIQKHLDVGLASHTPGHGLPATATPAMHAAEEPAAPSTGPALSVPHVDEIASAYLAISQALGARQQSDDAIGVDALLAAARQSHEHAKPEAKPLVEAVVKAAEGMQGKSLADQRKAFMALSDATIALLDRSPPTNAAAGELYVAYCPMAFDDAGAQWLQSVKDIANPYYATQMKRCGEVKRTIPARPAGAAK